MEVGGIRKTKENKVLLELGTVAAETRSAFSQALRDKVADKATAIRELILQTVQEISGIDCSVSEESIRTDLVKQLKDPPSMLRVDLTKPNERTAAGRRTLGQNGPKHEHNYLVRVKMNSGPSSGPGYVFLVFLGSLNRNSRSVCLYLAIMRP